jgi:ParB family chromosome partitioning protein
MATGRTTAKSSRSRQSGSRRARVIPRKDKRGLDAAQIVLAVDAPEVATLSTEVRAGGGAPLGANREPLSGRAVLLAALPVGSVEPTPFQRDLSPTHAKRLAVRIEEAGSFLDPLIVVRGSDGRLWTPNGRHRLAAAKILGLKQITALVSPDEDLAFRILALNTEKAHNLRDKSLEVIRMAQSLARRKPKAKESEFAGEFEAPELLTLGLIYERNGRFGGGAYSPFLKKVDRFSDRTLAVSLRNRRDYAARIVEIEAQVKRIIDGLQKRGFKSPYLRSYVVARVNPVRFHKTAKGQTKPPMPIGEALTRMSAAAKKFDLESVKAADVALVAAVAGGEG